MILLLLLFGLALGAESPSGEPEVKLQRGNCPPFWYSFNGRCYKYVASRLPWADAELRCVSEEANLVSIHSQDEEDFVRTLIRNFDHTEGYTWIGLSDEHKERSMMWSDGCAVKFGFWHPGEPNNQEGIEDCVHNNYDREGRWNDESCSESFPFVCASRIFCP